MSQNPGTQPETGKRKRPFDTGQMLWLVFAIFAAGAVWEESTETMFDLGTPYGWGKPVIWIAFVGFLAYSAEATRRDNLFGMIRVMMARPWGRQIGIDLYLGLFMFAGMIWLVTGSLAALAIWLAALCVFGNMASLLWLIINYDLIVARLTG